MHSGLLWRFILAYKKRLPGHFHNWCKYIYPKLEWIILLIFKKFQWLIRRKFENVRVRSIEKRKFVNLFDVFVFPRNHYHYVWTRYVGRYVQVNRGTSDFTSCPGWVMEGCIQLGVHTTRSRVEHAAGTVDRS